MPTEYTASNIIGQTIFVANGRKYGGRWFVSTATLDAKYPHCVMIHDATWGGSWGVRLTDCFATEAEARDAIKARKKAAAAERAAARSLAALSIAGGWADASALHLSR